MLLFQISKIFKSPQIIFLGSQGLEFISKDYPPFTCDMDMYEKCINNLRYTHVRKVELVDFLYTDTTILDVMPVKTNDSNVSLLNVS